MERALSWRANRGRLSLLLALFHQISIRKDTRRSGKFFLAPTFLGSETVLLNLGCVLPSPGGDLKNSCWQTPRLWRWTPGIRRF